MAHDAARAAKEGAAALVTGGLAPDGQLDADVFEAVRDAAPGIPLVCHKAFDRAADLEVAFDHLLRLGVTRVLTSGGAPTAWEGRDHLRALHRRSAGRCTVLAGGGVRSDHAAALVRHTGLTELHANGRNAETIRALVLVRYFTP
jgi:copper homeostasis protein